MKNIFVQPDSGTPGGRVPYMVPHELATAMAGDAADIALSIVKTTIFPDIVEELKSQDSQKSFAIEIAKLDTKWIENGPLHGRISLQVRVSGQAVDKPHEKYGFTFWEQEVRDVSHRRYAR